MGEKNRPHRIGHRIGEASELLGISKEAVRKKIQRKTIEAEKNQRGEWIVYLDLESVQDVQDKQDTPYSQAYSQAYSAESEWFDKFIAEKDARIESLINENEAKQRQIEVLMKQAENNQVLMLGLQQQNQLLLSGSVQSEVKEKRNFFFWNKSK